MELSFGAACSEDKLCGICFETIIKPVGKSSFGILPNCNHCFCLKCIRTWRRAEQFENNITRFYFLKMVNLEIMDVYVGDVLSVALSLTLFAPACPGWRPRRRRTSSLLTTKELMGKDFFEDIINILIIFLEWNFH
jgi:Zinc finger, C3HC4 type (RING finger)